MHEMSLAISIVDLVCAKAAAVRATRVSEIELEVGALAGVTIESLVFCFEAAAKETPAQTALLTVREVSGRARCSSCARIFPVDSLVVPCPHCGAYTADIIGGRELRVVSFVIDE